MKKIFVFAVMVFMFWGTVNALAENPLTPAVQPSVILKNLNSFLIYLADYKPSRDFVAHNSDLKPISKLMFLEKLATGNYIPLRLNGNDNKLHYSLYKTSNTDIGGIVQAYAYAWLSDYKKEGKKFPAFNFVDINGVKYNSANTKGKVLVVKCWYIGCQRCEAEMPELNQLKARYKNREDIIFISLAFDSKLKLQAFLKRKRFDYPIVANQRNFMVKNLNVEYYPTHFIIDKKGMVVNVVDDPEGIDWALQHRI